MNRGWKFDLRTESVVAVDNRKVRVEGQLTCNVPIVLSGTEYAASTVEVNNTAILSTLGKKWSMYKADLSLSLRMVLGSTKLKIGYVVVFKEGRPVIVPTMFGRQPPFEKNYPIVYPWQFSNEFFSLLTFRVPLSLQLISVFRVWELKVKKSIVVLVRHLINTKIKA